MSEKPLESQSSELGYVPAFCLKTNQLVKLSYPIASVGGLYTCPFCGVVEDTIENSYHVFNPSKPLLERLGYKEDE